MLTVNLCLPADQYILFVFSRTLQLFWTLSWPCPSWARPAQKRYYQIDVYDYQIKVASYLWQWCLRSLDRVGGQPTYIVPRWTLKHKFVKSVARSEYLEVRGPVSTSEMKWEKIWCLAVDKVATRENVTHGQPIRRDAWKPQWVQFKGSEHTCLVMFEITVNPASFYAIRRFPQGLPEVKIGFEICAHDAQAEVGCIPR